MKQLTWRMSRTIPVLLAALAVVAIGLSIPHIASAVTPQDEAAASAPPASGEACAPPSSVLVEPFYGMQFVPLEDLATVKDLGVEVVLASLSHDGTPTDWLAYLDAAHALNLRVIPWLWPQGWSWDGSSWQIDAQAALFVQSVAEHPALLAVYALHEPYWQGCVGCGYTTAEQQALYDAIKDLADVPIYSEIGGIAYWTAYSPETAFEDGICDYCSTWHYPFKDGGVYEREQSRAILEADLAVASERAPNSKIVWTMQAMVYAREHLRMPTGDEMRDHAAIVYASDVAGAWWYLWTFDGHYDDVLSNHPELYPVVSEIYGRYVLPRKDIHCLYLPYVRRIP
jgi:hypothetical protein